MVSIASLGNPLHIATGPFFIISASTLMLRFFSKLGASLAFLMNVAQGHPEAGFRNAAKRRTTNENSTAIFILQEKILSLLKISNMKETNDYNQKEYQLKIFTLGL